VVVRGGRDLEDAVHLKCGGKAARCLRLCSVMVGTVVRAHAGDNGEMVALGHFPVGPDRLWYPFDPHDSVL
jgi:hypothetical protein